MAKENIRSATSRAKLQPRREPYWENLGAGVGLGFRKLPSGSETWIGRKKNKDQKYEYKSFGVGDYFSCKREVDEWAAVRVKKPKEAVTVSDVCEAYVENRRLEKGEKTAYDAEKRFERLIYEKPLGAIELEKLIVADVEKWRNSLLDSMDPEDEESYNRAKDSANRNLKSLKAALNYSMKSGLITTDAGWKGVNQFPNVGARRNGWLNAAERTRLLENMGPELKRLATALLLIGARPGELANANAEDFDANGGVLRLEGKTGKREIPLSDKARKFFTARAKGKRKGSPLFRNPFNERWTAAQWGKEFREVREEAKLPDAVLYCMRHTYISEAIAQGLDVYTVANLTGTSVEIIQSNYGTLTDNIRERLNSVSIL